MLGRYVKMTAQPGTGDAVSALMLEVARSLNGTDGCDLYVVNQTDGEPDTIWVTELWRDQEAVDASLEVLQTESGKARLGEVMALLDGRPERVDLKPLGGVGLQD
ncbi:MAG: putative quinol monooxygenase [Solirubrobacteraceae bacterium]